MTKTNKTAAAATATTGRKGKAKPKPNDDAAWAAAEAGPVIAVTAADEAAVEAALADVVVEDKVHAARAEARRRMNEATKATSAHAYALIGCEGDTADERLAAMRARLQEWPESIRRAACRIAMTEKAEPGSKTQAMLKRLHDEQPIVASEPRGGGVGRRFSVVARGGKKGPDAVPMVYIPTLGVAGVGEKIVVLDSVDAIKAAIERGAKIVGVIKEV